MELKEIQDVVVYPFILFIAVMISQVYPWDKTLTDLNMLNCDCNLLGGVIV